MQGYRPNYAWHDLSLYAKRKRFMSYVKKLATGCWVWDRKRFRNHYGCMQISRNKKHRYLLAHRVAWELFRGPIPPGMRVLHKCDNPPCIRYNKCLFLGTAKQNSQDMLRKKRGNPPRGERSARARLSAKDVIKIRQAVEAGESQKAQAAQFHVSQKQISVIVSRKQWAHI